MGIAVKNSAKSLAYARTMVARETAKAIINLLKGNISIKRILTKKAINNAFIVNFALGGSTQVMNYLIEIATACDVDMNIDKALAISKGVPVLVDTTKDTTTFINNGGTYALLKELSKLGLIDDSIKIYSGMSLADELKQVPAGNFEKIRKESLLVLRGNLAEKLALIKTLSIPEGKTKFAGRAVVFKDDSSAASALLSRSIKAGTVIVITNCGKVSGQGGKIIAETACALESMGMASEIVVVTDGNISDSNNAMVIGNVRPEDGNLLLVRDNDEIEIDFIKQRLELEVNSKELSIRQKKFVKDYTVVPNFIKPYIKR
jgi:dihydroxy-acid dehydratase